MAYTIYKDRNNTFALQLLKNGTALTTEEIGAITKVEILHNGNYYNSEEFSTAFDLATRADEGVIVFKLGEIDDLAAGQDTNAELIIYSADYLDGLVWAVIDLQIVELFGDVLAGPV